ncbi:MAG: PKD domain-containing protein [Bacteroidota bacterium]
MDSVRMVIIDTAGMIFYSDTMLYPEDSINIVGPGIFYFTATAYNGCAPDGVSIRDTFRLFDSPRPAFDLDTNFICVGESVQLADRSEGDIDRWQWSVIDLTSGMEVLDSEEQNPLFTFPESFTLGRYRIMVNLSNPQCDAIPWDTIITLSAPPELTMEPIPDGCGEANVLPTVFYGIGDTLIDSVRMIIVDTSGMIFYSDTMLRPMDSINIEGPGIFHFTATAYNGCAPDGVSIRDTFRLFDSPRPAFDLDSNFVCIGGSVQLTNRSEGDISNYAWTVFNPNGDSVLHADIPSPLFTFPEGFVLGRYRITVNLSNPRCDVIPWDTIITLSAPPELTMDTIPDGCGEANVLPTVFYGIGDTLIDSVRMIIVDTSGMIFYSDTMLRPMDSINIVGPGIFHFTATAYNGCAPDGVSIRDTFRLFDSPRPNFELDTNFVCIGGSIQLTDRSEGDITRYQWSVRDSSETVVLMSTEASPNFTFAAGLALGFYEVSVNVSNPQCDVITWDTIIRLSAPPEVSLDSIGNFCEEFSLLPDVEYNIDTSLFDSVRWTLTVAPNDSLVYTTHNRDFFPDSIRNGLNATYTLSVFVFNGCGMDSASQSFRVLEGPDPNFSLNNNFFCIGDTIFVTDSSGGEDLIYDWVVDEAAFTLINQGDAEPIIIVNGPIGEYEIRVELSNEVCMQVPWLDSVRISDRPRTEIDTIVDFCGEVRFAPSATFSNEDFIDASVWTISSIDGSFFYRDTTLLPDTLTYEVGVYGVVNEVSNECGVFRDSTSFQVFRAPVLDIRVDTNFICIEADDNMQIINNSTGDSLRYNWSFEGDGTVTFTPPDSPTPLVTFGDTGVFILITEVTNPVCDPVFWRDTVVVSTRPQPTLLDQTEFCEEVALTPVVDYFTFRFDSVRWDFTGSTLDDPISTELFPMDIPYVGAGDYIYSLTVFSPCGPTVLMDTFRVDTIPEIILGPTDTFCITDPPTFLPPAFPPGGIWRDSLGRPDVITEAGEFDPAEAGGGITVVEYVYDIGACQIITSKDVFVVDLDSVRVEPTVLNSCVSDTLFILDNGMPPGGWYVGDGVTDSILGHFNPASVGVGSVMLTYFYQFPGTNCIAERDFTMNVQPLPEPDITVTDSICVNVPVQLFHTGVGAVNFVWVVNDSIVSTEENPFYAFTDTGRVEVQLISESEFGCRDSISGEVYVSGPPIAQFNMDPDTGCAVLEVVFTDESIPFQFATYEWDYLGNDSISTNPQGDTVFYDQGRQDTMYFPELLVRNHCGEDLFRDTVTVFPLPLAEMDLSRDFGCDPLLVEFNNLTAGLPDSFAWFIDGELYWTDSIPPNREFFAPDSVNVTYEIMLVAFNECGIDTTIREIIVQPDDIRAFFSVDNPVGCEEFEVAFRNTSSVDTLVTFFWDFGDGTSSTEANPVHFFSNATDSTVVYDVVLYANNGCGQDSITLPITVHPAPPVSFTAPPITCARDTVFFTNTSIGTGDPIWIFGDGDTLTRVENPGHVYDQPGIYTVELTAFDQNTGCPNTFTLDVEIRPIPTAAFSVNPNRECPDLTVTFTNQSTNADFFEWDFGDGNTTVGPGNVTHTYTESGFYEVTLIATDEFGCFHDTTFRSIQVYEVPIIDFEVFQDRQCGVPTQVCIENFTTNAGGYRWDFGNGETSEENDPCTMYDTPGEYTITLTATNEFLCETTVSQTITIYGEPVAAVALDTNAVCAETEVVFRNISEFWEFAEWTFSDGFFTTGSEAVRYFSNADTGWYGLTLVVWNGSGCRDTFTDARFFRVNPAPLADFDFIDRTDNLNFLPTTYEFIDLSSADVNRYEWYFNGELRSREANPIIRFLSSFDQYVEQVVYNEFGCSDTAVAEIDLDTLTGLFIPNIMHPDNEFDGKRYFQPKGIGLTEFHIGVYARNGQLVWESTSLSDDGEGIPDEFWDGTFRNEPLPQGAYVWKIHKARFFNDRPWGGMPDRDGTPRRSGFLYLVR